MSDKTCTPRNFLKAYRMEGFHVVICAWSRCGPLCLRRGCSVMVMAWSSPSRVCVSFDFSFSFVSIKYHYDPLWSQKFSMIVRCWCVNNVTLCWHFEYRHSDFDIKGKVWVWDVRLAWHTRERYYVLCNVINNKSKIWITLNVT